MHMDFYKKNRRKQLSRRVPFQIVWTRSRSIWSGSKPFDTMIVFLKELFWIVLERSADYSQSIKNYPACKELNGRVKHLWNYRKFLHFVYVRRGMHWRDRTDVQTHPSLCWSHMFRILCMCAVRLWWLCALDLCVKFKIVEITQN